MGAGFNIIVHRNDENVHFKLIGDFDDKAVNQLIDALKLHARDASRIFIHTDALNTISGCDERRFQNRLYNGAEISNTRILSTGRFSNMFSPA